MQTLEADLDLTEIINGEEIMGPSPFGKHQRIVFNLADIMRHYVIKNGLGEVCLSPLDVIFEDSINRLQPDIIFIRKENMAIFQDWIRGVPDMVCEIVSPGTYRRDTAVKREIYEKYKLPEYWIVIPELLTIEILTIENNRYITHSIAELEGVVQSKIIDGLNVNIRDIFDLKTYV
ncbi:Uma2 family endonuclease [Candidatus Magnetominusculus dajiuhuensis]|uniref:Uma2 family endonuclease n=1 Tax=Candidatus Magnetominusculus dajiuhuensis TaxID=3137712 RepID=UPI003B42AD08